MNAVVKIENTAMQAMTEGELMGVLQSSLYPGAKPESIKLVLGYCKAAGLDPMQKPVHIVPISVKVGDNYQMRDTVMPGIGLYRTQAARTGQYAGITEPEFGPTKTLKVGEFTLDYPEWCRVTVKRMVVGMIVEFTANERWLENYATAKRDTAMPNAMWKRRPFAQLAKCAEAQALRKAFPELGAQPTADEMEGRTLEEVDITPARDVSAPQRLSKLPAKEAPAIEQEPPPASIPQASEPACGETAIDMDGPKLSESQIRILKKRMEGAALTEVDVSAKFGHALEALPASAFNAVSEYIKNPVPQS